MRHDADLPVLLLNAVLADADRIDPELAAWPRLAEEGHGVKEVLDDVKGLAIDKNRQLPRLIAPHVGDGLIMRTLAEADMRQSALNRSSRVCGRFNGDESDAVSGGVQGLVNKAGAPAGVDNKGPHDAWK